MEPMGNDCMTQKIGFLNPRETGQAFRVAWLHSRLANADVPDLKNDPFV